MLINEEDRETLSKIFEEKLVDPFKFLVEVYREVLNVGGETMANNLLKLSASKKLEEREVDFLVFSVREVALE